MASGSPRFVEWLLAYRADAPTDDAERRVLAIRVATILLFCGGTLCLAILPIAALSHVQSYNTLGIAIPASFGVLLAPAAYWLDRRYLMARSDRAFWNLLFAWVVVASVLVSLGQYFAGGQLPFGAVLYIWAAMVAFLFFSRARAAAIVVVICAEYALVTAVGRDFVGPAVQWVFLVATIVVTAVVLDWLVRHLRALRESERQARAELAEINTTLEARVAEQVEELGRLGRLRRFLPTPVADAVLSADTEHLLEPHRREIAVFFCDLRGFTAFAAGAQPEEVDGVLTAYFDLLGEMVGRYQATVGAFTGDGLMAFFNDPLPVDQPALRAVTMAVDLRMPMASLLTGWQRQGYDLGFGVGIAFGYANIGTIGFEGRRDYTALGPVVNLAARLCAEAQSGETLIDQRASAACDGRVEVTEPRLVALKGYRDPVTTYCVTALSGDQPAAVGPPD